MTHKFGPGSEKELIGVHPKIVKVSRKALIYSAIDFGIHDGLRTDAEQAEYVRTGVSKTLNSKHKKQPDGYGHAVDAVPYIGGKLRWEWPPIFVIARAFQKAAIEEDVPIIWGAIWDRNLNDLSTNLEAEVEAYKRRHPGPDFLDGPHYQLSK